MYLISNYIHCLGGSDQNTFIFLRGKACCSHYPAEYVMDNSFSCLLFTLRINYYKTSIQFHGKAQNCLFSTADMLYVEFGF